MANTQQANLVCPKCQTQNIFPISTAQSNYQFTCPKCNSLFISRVVKIRAKNSRQDKRSNTRSYSVRIIDFSGREELIEFGQSGISDFELRAGDLASFNYLSNKLLIVQNLTIGRFLSLKSGCSKAAVIICIILLALVVGFCALGKIGQRQSYQPVSTPTSSPLPIPTPSPTTNTKTKKH